MSCGLDESIVAQVGDMVEGSVDMALKRLRSPAPSGVVRTLADGARYKFMGPVDASPPAESMEMRPTTTAPTHTDVHADPDIRTPKVMEKTDDAGPIRGSDGPVRLLF